MAKNREGYIDYNFQGESVKVKVIVKSQRNMYMRISKNEVCVTVPKHASHNDMMIFINEHIHKFVKHLKLKEENKKVEMNSSNNNFVHIFGIKYKLVFLENKKNGYKLEKDTLFVIHKPEKQEKVFRDVVNTIFMIHIDNIKDAIINKMELYPSSLSVKKLKSRWGFCNIKSRNIVLNSDLLYYSKDTIEYVLIHELAHLAFASHSKNFWDLVEKYCSNYKKNKKELNY